MTWYPVLTHEQELELVNEYLGEDDWTINELSVMFKVSHRTVYRVLAKHDVHRDKLGRNRKRLRNGKGQFNPKPARPKTEKERKPLQPCGTDAAYRRHKYHGEYPCPPCLEAHAAKTKSYKEKK